VTIDLAKLFDAVFMALFRALSKFGIKTEARMPMMAMTINNSIKVNPDLEFDFIRAPGHFFRATLELSAVWISTF
jgi:hypothetical protein